MTRHKFKDSVAYDKWRKNLSKSMKKSWAYRTNTDTQVFLDKYGELLEEIE